MSRGHAILSDFPEVLSVLQTEWAIGRRLQPQPSQILRTEQTTPGQHIGSEVRKERGWRGRGGGINVLNRAAAVEGCVPIGYDGGNNLMAVRQNNLSRLTITYYYKKSSLNSVQPLYPNATDPSINNKFELGPQLGPSSLWGPIKAKVLTQWCFSPAQPSSNMCGSL